MYRAEVHVTFKKGVLDPQGQTVARSLKSLGFEGVRDARIGRFIELLVEGASEDEVREAVDGMCRQLLANPVLEEYHVEIVRVEDKDGNGIDGAEA